jgi:predicted nuclease of predicted toxin-antitoxin system
MVDRPQTFLLDENIPRKVLSTLRKAGYVAARVYDEKLYSQSDVAVFTHARARHMTIITFDTDYLDKIAFSPPHAGILVLRSFPRNTSVNDIASAILRAVGLLADLDIANKVYTLTPEGLEEVS